MVHTDLRQQLLGWRPRSEQEAGEAHAFTRAGRELGGYPDGAPR